MRGSNSFGLLLPEDSAPQHERGPRPLPLFLEMVRMAARDDPDMARDALRGLAAYQVADRVQQLPRCPTLARSGGAALLDCGGIGPPAILVPSLINPPNVLDLDPDSSLAAAVAAMGRRALLLDWGPARDRATLDVAGHVDQLLLPLIDGLPEPPALIGYCLGGTMAIAAANLRPVDRLVTLAAPWHFSAYPQGSRDTLTGLWASARQAAEALGALPMEVLQSAFWSLDPGRTVAKFADFARADPASATARRFIALEDWANDGEALPYPAARELIEDLFGADLPGADHWRVGGVEISDKLDIPVLHCTAGRDQIAPAETVAAGREERIAAGHVGMIVGSARSQLHGILGDFLDPACR